MKVAYEEREEERSVEHNLVSDSCQDFLKGEKRLSFAREARESLNFFPRSKNITWEVIRKALLSEVGDFFLVYFNKVLEEDSAGTSLRVPDKT